MKLIAVIICCSVFTEIVMAQNERWVYRYDGPAEYSIDVAHSIVYGADGNIYAAGKSKGVSTSFDLIVISMTAIGDTNWIYRYDGPINSSDIAHSIVYGDDGNLYVVGSSVGSNANSDFMVINLTTSGDTNWTYRYNGPENGTDEANTVVYGEDGNIYAAGYSQGNGPDFDFIVISLDILGSENWVYRYDAPIDNSIDIAHSIVYGADGNIYAAGFSAGISVDFTVISLAPNGDANWTYIYDGPGNGTDIANSLVYGADGNIYAGGSSTGMTTDEDFTVISLDTLGNKRWVYSYDGPGTTGSYDYDRAYSIVYGADGNIYAAGHSTGDETYSDLMMMSLTTSGDTNWTYRYNGPGNYTDDLWSMAYGLDGNIYAAGNSYDSITGVDFVVMSLDTNGKENWIYRYDRPAHSVDQSYSIVYGYDGNIYAAGYSVGGSTYEDFIVISLGAVGVEENTNQYEPIHYLYQATPNPFSDYTEIRYQITDDRSQITDNRIQIKIYNIAGRLVRQWDYQTIRLSDHIIWQGDDDSGKKLPNGVYFIKFKADEYTEIKKALITR